MYCQNNAGPFVVLEIVFDIFGVSNDDFIMNATSIRYDMRLLLTNSLLLEMLSLTRYGVIA